MCNISNVNSVSLVTTSIFQPRMPIGNTKKLRCNELQNFDSYRYDFLQLDEIK